MRVEMRPALILVLLLCSIPLVHAELRLVRILPETVHAVADIRGRHLNFDLLLENTRSVPVTIDYLEIEAFDADGRLVLRRHLGGGGNPAAVAMLPRRVVPPLGRLHLFNPFPVLPADLEFATLRLGIYHDGGRLAGDPRPGDRAAFRPAGPALGGDLFVESGADLLAPHRRWSLVSGEGDLLDVRRNSARFAIDLTRVDDAGRYRDGPREVTDNWFAWDGEVRTPVEGRVVAVRDDLPDNRLRADGGFEPAAGASEAPLGNHVVVELAPEVFLLLAHLQQGSVRVEPGDRVWAGALLGRIGMSGESTWPHLHVQLQRGADPLDSEPLPLVFACVRDAGGGMRRPAFLATGDRVGPCAIGRR
ncbi:MAG: M23 family metallopeptidase [Gammaproteobacteria bacterium]|nr:M23 family metallopeptidase [Gammaproteobacteria bacterium]